MSDLVMLMAVTQVIERPSLMSPTSELHFSNTPYTWSHVCFLYCRLGKESPLQDVLHQLALERELTDIRWLSLWASE